jgi:hypothetical protein
MTNQQTGVPHALQAAAKAVIKSAKKTTKKYRKGKSAKQNPVEAIRRFAKALYRNRESSKELKRRATLVASESQPDTPLRNRIDDAFDCYQKQKKPSGEKSPANQQLRRRLEQVVAFWSTHERKTVFQFTSDLRDFVKTINQATRRGIIPRPCADLFALMGDEAERLADDAREVEADGCYFIFHVHRANARSAPDNSNVAVEILASRSGTAHLKSIASAVESLMAWVSSMVDDANSSTTADEQPKPGDPVAGAYPSAKTYARDEWIYKNIHLNSCDTLSVKLKKKAKIEKWAIISSRNGLKKAADRHADYHKKEKRRFKKH